MGSEALIHEMGRHNIPFLKSLFSFINPLFSFLYNFVNLLSAGGQGIINLFFQILCSFIFNAPFSHCLNMLHCLHNLRVDLGSLGLCLCQRSF